MKDGDIRQTGELEGAGLRCQASPPPHRILVVDDEALIRNLNTKVLIDSGYHVDAVEDGAAAWDTLQQKSYHLLITDNAMPKVTGVELIEKVRSAGLAIPVIMATGTLPKEEFTRRPWLQPAATLVKPYTVAEFLGTVKNVLREAIPTALLLFCLPAVINAQNAIQPPLVLRIASPDSAARTNAAQPHSVRLHAVALSVHGKCDCSEDGVTFTNLERGDNIEQGAIVRTGEEAEADLFFRRSGTTVRLQAGTEIRLEKIVVTIKDGHLAEHALLDLRKGRIFTVIRSAVAGSTLEVRNSAGRSVVEGSGVGSYIITADGTHVSAVGSVIPLKVIGENGTTIISAGQQFARQEGKMLPVSSRLYVQDLIQLDKLQALTEWTAP
jgi:DNA-binding response OmpR family regulator